MDEVSIYIKRIIAFSFCLISVYFLSDYFPVYYIIPVFLLIFSLLNYQITGQKPAHLFNHKRAEIYFEKGGLRELIRIITIIPGFIFNIIVWIVWGLYLAFHIIIDIYSLFKLIIYWIIHAFIWFLKLYVPPLIILFRSFIHYLFKWPWWIYRLSFLNARFAYNKPFYFIALRGSIFALLLVFAFYYLGFLVHIDGLVFIGFILAIVPVSWSFGEISSVRSRDLYTENYRTVKKNFSNGIESVRSILYYLALFIILFIVQISLNLAGWIPKAGMSLIGIPVNINTFINILLLFLFILIVFGSMIIPSYRLYNEFRENSFSDTLQLLGLIFRKGLQYIFSLLPSSLFSVFILIIPVLIIYFAYKITDHIKNNIIEIRIETLQEKQSQSETRAEAYYYGKQMEDLIIIREDIPEKIPEQLTLLSGIDDRIAHEEEVVMKEQKELNKIENEYNKHLLELEEQIIEASTYTNRFSKNRLEELKSEKVQSGKNFLEMKREKIDIIQEYKIDVEYLKNKKMQIPFTVLFAGLWIVIFAGILMAFLIAYLGNLYYDIFLFRNDRALSYFMHLIRTEREKDHKQPLLGFTLLFVTAIIIILIAGGYHSVITELYSSFTIPF